MHPDEDSQTTLSKWPFILGDVLLVATALAIAILGHGQLTNWQVASCVISVALGAALFVLPYVVEFQVRLREEREDRGAELRILHKHVVNGREELEAAAERIEAVEVAIRSIDQSAPDLSAPIAALEKKLEPIAGQQLQINEQFSAISKQVDQLSLKLKQKLDVKSLKAVEDELASLKKELAELPATMLPPSAPEAASEPKATLEKSAESEKTPTKKIDRPSRSPRERQEPKPRLLKRAINEKQDKSSAAVSRIIESKQKDEEPKEALKEPALEPEKKPESKEKKTKRKVEEDLEPTIARNTDSEAKEVPKPTEEISEPVTKKEIPKPTGEDQVEPKEAEAPTPRPVKVNKPVEKEASEPAPEKKEVLEPEAKEEQTAGEPQNDMFGESVPAKVKKRVRTKKNDTAVIASVFIGIGNKPFVRGSGAGLSWDSGVEMEFEEIGRWRWIAPADLEDPIEIQLYRNDEDFDSTGKYTLQPGQQLDLSPVF